MLEAANTWWNHVDGRLHGWVWQHQACDGQVAAGPQAGVERDLEGLPTCLPKATLSPMCSGLSRGEHHCAPAQCTASGCLRSGGHGPAHSAAVLLTAAQSRLSAFEDLIGLCSRNDRHDSPKEDSQGRNYRKKEVCGVDPCRPVFVCSHSSPQLWRLKYELKLALS